MQARWSLSAGAAPGCCSEFSTAVCPLEHGCWCHRALLPDVLGRARFGAWVLVMPRRSESGLSADRPYSDKRELPDKL